MRHVFELNFVIFLHQPAAKKCSSKCKGHGFSFKLLVYRVVRELFGVKRQGLYWEHTKWCNEVDVV
jgi:hypothetical protein